MLSITRPLKLGRPMKKRYHNVIARLTLLVSGLIPTATSAKESKQRQYNPKLSY